MVFIPAVAAVEPIVPEMTVVPGGPFIFGASRPVEKDSITLRWTIPAKTVECPTFSIAIHETTTAEMRRFILDGGYDRPAYWAREARPLLPQYRSEIDERYPDDDTPCTGINYYEAQAYCAWLAQKTGQPYRLPTEIEWEKAARGMDGRQYPWGNEWNPKACNWNDDTNGDLKPDGKIDGWMFVSGVGDFPEGASPYGCLGMAGNVREWCADWIGVPGEKRFRVLRGGCYRMVHPRHFKTTFRGGASPQTGLVFHGITGFRIALNE